MPPSDRDREMMREIDDVFASTRATYGAALPCSRGCSLCCVSFFAVTAVDLWRLREAFQSLDGDIRAALIERANAVVAAVAEALPEWKAPYDIREIGEEAFASLAAARSQPCPALDTGGSCLIYDSRPRICRLQGLSYFERSTGATLPDFCAEIFGSGDYSAIPPQPLALSRQWASEAESRDEVAAELPSGMRGNYRTYVAAAIALIASDLR